MDRCSEREDRLGRALGARWRARVFRECGSTMDEAKRLAATSDRIVVVADRQISGRGRRGNEWRSPPGGLYATFGISLAGPLSRASGLSLAAGVEIVEAASLLGGDVALKWPNDLVHAPTRRKLGGILIELIAGPLAQMALIGIGINLVPEEHRNDSISLAECLGIEYEPHELVAVLAPRLEAACAICMEEGFGPYRDRWLAYTVHRGATIAVDSGEGIVRGEFVGIDSSGSLQLSVEGRIAAVQAGHLLEW